MKNKLYVGRLGKRTTRKRILVAFQTIGKVATVELVTDTQSGASKGFAFVTFTDVRDAERAIEILNGTNLDNYEIAVRWAASNDENRKPQWI